MNDRPARPRQSPALRWGSIVLATASLGILAAPITILAALPDLTTRASRHAFAGAMGLIALAILNVLLALVPVRRGERWAIAASAVCFLIVGLPVLVVDAAHVAPTRLWSTLAPQVAGLVVGGGALVACALGARRT